MLSLRLSAILLLVIAIPALGQQQQSDSRTSLGNSAPTAKPPVVDGTLNVLKDLADGKLQLQLDSRGSNLLADRNNGGKFLVVPLQADDLVLLGDEICYTLRTYVVARDTKDSDSTHPVKSTTCQMGSRFQLKTAIVHAEDGNR
ncbi:MAG TPA: hypothetical protein VMH04_02400 [Candidatus Solibacter sp.]|nr:hypothetical protein [Candidatus Solibacter sp.]